MVKTDPLVFGAVIKDVENVLYVPRAAKQGFAMIFKMIGKKVPGARQDKPRANTFQKRSSCSHLMHSCHV